MSSDYVRTRMIRPLNLTSDELDQLEAFLNALEGGGARMKHRRRFPNDRAGVVR